MRYFKYEKHDFLKRIANFILIVSAHATRSEILHILQGDCNIMIKKKNVKFIILLLPTAIENQKPKRCYKYDDFQYEPVNYTKLN